MGKKKNTYSLSVFLAPTLTIHTYVPKVSNEAAIIILESKFFAEKEIKEEILKKNGVCLLIMCEAAAGIKGNNEFFRIFPLG